MSKTPQDWLDTYYPTPANSPEALATPAAHSLRKWQGLVPEVLEEYGLYVEHGDVMVKRTGVEIISIHGGTCALCVMYDDWPGTGDSYGCTNCPISVLRDGYRCDMQTPDEEGSKQHPPYGHFIRYNDPYPMIHLLEKAVEKEKGECPTT